jgi:hypothetical protein
MIGSSRELGQNLAKKSTKASLNIDQERGQPKGLAEVLWEEIATETDFGPVNIPIKACGVERVCSSGSTP